MKISRLLILLVLIVGCKVKQPITSDRDSIRYVYKVEHKTDTLWKKINIRVPVDCDKKDTIYIKVGELTGQVITGNGKATTSINGKVPQVTMTDKVTEKSSKVKVVVMKPDVIKIYPLWWAWLMLLISLILNLLFIYNKFS